MLYYFEVSVLQNKTTKKKNKNKNNCLSYFDISCSTSAQSNKNNTRGTQKFGEFVM